VVDLTKWFACFSLDVSELRSLLRVGRRGFIFRREFSDIGEGGQSIFIRRGWQGREACELRELVEVDSDDSWKAFRG
jgi:hypothetical protein